MTTAVVIADRGSDMARLTACVGALPHTPVVRHASGHAPVGRLVRAQAPSLVLIGEMSPRRLTAERVSEVRATAPGATVVVVAGDAGSRWLAEALRAGATAVLPGDMSADALVAVLQEVIASNPGSAVPHALAA
jgi:DNA-binding NarL/FixJ family response regulator